jgi:hypothetical protein
MYYTVLLPPGGYPIAVNKYIISYIMSVSVVLDGNSSTLRKKVFFALESQENTGTDLVLVYTDHLSVEAIKVIDEFPLDM